MLRDKATRLLGMSGSKSLSGRRRRRKASSGTRGDSVVALRRVVHPVYEVQDDERDREGLLRESATDRTELWQSRPLSPTALLQEDEG